MRERSPKGVGVRGLPPRPLRGYTPPHETHPLPPRPLAPLPMLAADPPAEVTNSIGMKLVRIAPGEFMMGTGTEPPKSLEEWSKRD